MPFHGGSAPQVFTLPRSAIWEARVAFALFSIFALGSLALAIVSPSPGIGGHLVMLGCAVAHSSFALLPWRSALLPATTTIELSDQYFRQSGRDAYPWTSVHRLRVRPIFHRVALLDSAGDALATLEMQLDDFPTALRTVVARTRHTRPNPRSAYQFPPVGLITATAIGVVASLLLAGVVYAEDGRLFGFLLPAGLVVACIIDYRGKILAVRLNDANVSIHRGKGTDVLAYDQIRDVSVLPVPVERGNRQLQLCIEFVFAPWTALRLPRTALFEVHDALAARCNRAAQTPPN